VKKLSRLRSAMAMLVHHHHHNRDHNYHNNNNNNNNNNNVFIIYMPSQQLQGKLQTQHRVDTGNYKQKQS
jgi:hypothetical protein